MSDLADLLASVATILRNDPDLRGLAPNWAADDARAHVFVGQAAIGATNAGRAPYAVLDLADVRQSPRHGGDRRDATTTATVVLRLVARHDIAGFVNRVSNALAAEANRDLGDPGHVLGFAIEHAAPERLGSCQAADLRLVVRMLAEPGG